jgi:O-antigen/teichoic acid export membrane protein
MGSHATPSRAASYWSTMRGSGRVLFANATSLIASTGLTSALGVVYWFVAAHRFSIRDVGIASAAISAMILLATLGSLGQGTFLLGELPSRDRSEVPSLIGSGLAVAAIIGAGLAFSYAAVGMAVLPAFRPFESPLGAVIFALGVAIMAMTMVADDVTIGLLRGGVQLWRNGVFGVAKLAFLAALAFLVVHGSGVVIYVTWTSGALISLMFITGLAVHVAGWRTVSEILPRRDIVRHSLRAILDHQLLNLSLRSGLVLPTFVLTVLVASYTASFYVALQVASLVIAVPSSFSTVLYAIGRTEDHRLPSKMRQSLLTCALVGAVSTIFVVLAGSWILAIFGRTYAHQATGALWLLTAGVFGTTMKDHYVALARIEKRIRAVLPLLYFGTFLELALALIGVIEGGLTGLAAGWLVGVLTEAAIMSRRVFGAARESHPVPGPVRSDAGHPQPRRHPWRHPTGRRRRPPRLDQPARPTPAPLPRPPGDLTAQSREQRRALQAQHAPADSQDHFLGPLGGTGWQRKTHRDS